MARSPYYYGGGGGALGITNPFAQNLPDLAKINESIASIGRNELLDEKTRLEIQQRAAELEWQRSKPDLGSTPSGAQTPQGALPQGTGTASPGGTLTPFVYANLPAGVSSEEDQIVRTVYGEAAGEGTVGRRAVASVIKNRAKQSGQSVQDVIFSRNQFEPWNNPQTRAKLESLDPNSRDYQSILADIRAGTDDPTGGATHFYSPEAQKALGRPPPSWGTGQPSTVIGRHNFYNLGYGQGSGAPGAPPGAVAGGPATPAPYQVATTGPTPGPPTQGPAATPTRQPLPEPIAQAARWLRDMPEADAAKAYPQVLEELRRAGVAIPNAPPAYPGHTVIDQMLGNAPAQGAQGAQAQAPGQAQGQAQGQQQQQPPAPQATPQVAPQGAAQTPAPQPPAALQPTNEQGLTTQDMAYITRMRGAPGRTAAAEASDIAAFRRHNDALKAKHQDEQQQYSDKVYQRGRDTAADQTAAETRRLAAENTAYQRQKDADAAARAGIPTGYERDPDKPGALRFIENGPADPKVIERNRRAAGEGRGASRLGLKDISTLADAASQAENMTRLNTTFGDYGGYGYSTVGEGFNLVARNLGIGDTKAADWWNDYQNTKNITRHEIFGAALTKTEKAEFERADINPGMTNAAIRTNLERRNDIVQKALQRYARGLAAGGYNTKQIQEATGIDVDAPENKPDAKPAADRPPLSTFRR